MFNCYINFKISIALLLFFCAQLSKSVEVRPCKDEIPTAIDFVSEGCSEPPCPLVKEKYSNANITFRIPADTATSEIKIRARPDNFNMWVPFPPPDKSTCHNLLNSYCPLDENEVVIYHLAIPVLKFYPAGLGMDLEISFLDDQKRSMMCLQVKCKVVEAES